MATVHFTSHLQKFAPCGAVTVGPGAVGEALAEALAENDQLKGYLFDDQNRLRRHIMVFVDGEIIADRVGLTDAVGEASEVYVMQALSGG